MSWRPAPAVVALQRTLDLARPGRRVRFPDGTIGDAKHAARKSDHNPDADGLVCAVDVHDSDVLDDGSLYESIKAAGRRNPVKYAINNGRIWSPERGEHAYHGPSPHPDHCHISVTQAGKRLAVDWVLPGITDRTTGTSTTPEEDDMALSKEGKAEVRQIVSDEVDRAVLQITGGIRPGDHSDLDKDHVSLADVLTRLDKLADALAPLVKEL